MITQEEYNYIMKYIKKYKNSNKKTDIFCIMIIAILLYSLGGLFVEKNVNNVWWVYILAGVCFILPSILSISFIKDFKQSNELYNVNPNALFKIWVLDYDIQWFSDTDGIQRSVTTVTQYKAVIDNQIYSNVRINCLPPGLDFKKYPLNYLVGLQNGEFRVIPLNKKMIQLNTSIIN